jgi:hypothetical protein
MIAAEEIPEGFRPTSPEGSLREVWEQLSLGTPASSSDKRKGPLIFQSAGLCCNPAEVQTELGRAGDSLSSYRNQCRRIKSIDSLLGK